MSFNNVLKFFDHSQLHDQTTIMPEMKMKYISLGLRLIIWAETLCDGNALVGH
jgi:hypothetical protein